MVSNTGLPKAHSRIKASSSSTELETGQGEGAGELSELVATKLDLLCQIGKKVGSAATLSQIVGQIIKMSQHTLRASASSVLLLDESNEELYFDVACGIVGNQLQRVRISTESGIAGWVARHGKPLVINDVQNDPRFNRAIDDTTGFVTKSMLCVPMVIHRQTIGVLQVINKSGGGDFTHEDLETLMSVASTAAMAIENARLHQSVLDGYKGTIRALAAAIDAKDAYTCGHSQRVVEYALLAGRSLPLSQPELEVLEYAGILHDIGKIGIPDAILRKPGYLTAEECAIIQEHSRLGANIIKGVPFLEEASRLVLHHHERYDGTGYPQGLSGEATPIGARILAVADTFDAMTTDRAYRPALSQHYALVELARCSGTQFCPVAAEAFISGFSQHQMMPYPSR